MRGVEEPEAPPESGESEADASLGKARTLVWLVAGCCLLVGGLDLGLYLFKAHQDHSSVSVWRCLWLSIPLVAGVLILLKTSALAALIVDWLDQ